MAFRDILRGIGDLILNNKLITFLSVALFAFVIATIALASENNSNANALDACRGQLWQATSVAPVTTTTLQPAESTTAAGGGESSTTEATSSTEQSSTTEATTPAPEPTPEGRVRKRRR